MLIFVGLLMALYANFKEHFAAEFYAQRIEAKFSALPPLETQTDQARASQKSVTRMLENSARIDTIFKSKFENPDEKFGREEGSEVEDDRGSTDLFSREREASERVEEEINRSRFGVKRDIDLTIKERDLPLR